MRSRLAGQWGGAVAQAPWQGVAAAKFSGLPGLTAGGACTYLRTCFYSDSIVRLRNGQIEAGHDITASPDVCQSSGGPICYLVFG